jgi:hypothetical protein
VPRGASGAVRRQRAARLRYPVKVTTATPLVSAAATRFLHVANGSSTTDTIHAAGLPGVMSVWADALHDGPVPGGLSDEELLPIRAKFLAEDSPERDGLAETAAELGRWRAVIQDTSAYDELVLWYEHDLFDQLNLIQVLALLGQQPPAGKRVSLICIGSFPGRARFKGLGELTPAELAPLIDTRQPVTDAQYALAARAWEAFRASDPRLLDALVRAASAGHGDGLTAGAPGHHAATDMSALPFLEAALHRHLEEFPWTTDGLSRTERRVMELAQAGPIAFADAFPRMHDDETAFFIADLSLQAVIDRLAVASPPLMVAGRMLTLTDTGRAVLAGEIDRVGHCGIDRWLGGVHLQGRCPTWRWNPDTQRIVQA